MKISLALWHGHLIIAGLIAAAMPGVLLAAPCVPTAAGLLRPPTVARLSTEVAGNKLIVSGRVVGSDCRGIAGALIEVWSASSSLGASATTDSEGHFQITAAAPLGGQVHIRVSYNGQTLVTQREWPGGPADGHVTHVTRDASNARRTTIGLTLA